MQAILRFLAINRGIKMQNEDATDGNVEIASLSMRY